MTDEFMNQIMKNVVGVLCQNIGWHAAQTNSVDILADLMKRHFLQLAKASHNYAEHYGRTEPNMDDAALALRDMGISVSELEEYVQNFDPVLLPYAKDVPEFPVAKDSKLNFLRPGSEEVLTRAVHVHEYMPPMIFDEPVDEKDSKSNEEKIDVESVDGTKLQVDVFEDSKLSKPVEPPKEKTPERETVVGITNGLSVKMDVTEKADESSEDEIEALESKANGSPGFTPFSGITPKSKREAVGENPALKRVRMMLEEEGHPLREITSVMMTTSGFLTSSREGRLPDTRPPPNREFFEPLPPPLLEKKKKGLLTNMKRIVEGIKKIDKEKENDSDKEREEPVLFGNPDKIYGSSASAAPIPSNENAEKLDKKSSDKDTIKDLKKLKKLKKLKLDKETIKRLSKGIERDRDKKKSKLFKKSQNKIILDKTLKKTKKVKDAKSALSKRVSTTRKSSLDNIESDEDFGSEIHPTAEKALPTLKQKKKYKIPDKFIKMKKPKDKLLSIPPAVIPIPKMSPLEKKMSGFNTGSIISPDGLPKKKRGRPRKNPLAGVPLPPAALAGLGRGLMDERHLKIKKSHMEPAMRSLIPDIKINMRPNIKPPRLATPSSNFDLLMGLPTTPGLIPTSSYILPPPPPLIKMPTQIPPSISITPATPSTPTPIGKDSKSSFSGLPSNVCSSVTITPIDMPDQKLPTRYDKTVTPGIGSPLLSVPPRGQKAKDKSSPTPPSVLPMAIKTEPSSGITITPIVMEKSDRFDGISSGDKPTAKLEKPQSMLAKLEEDMKSKEQRKKEKERRKELKKEKKKEKKEKEKTKDKDRDKERGEKTEKKEKRDKSDKKKKKDKLISDPVPVAALTLPAVPKLTLKLSSGTPTPVDSPNPPQVTIGGMDFESPPPPPPPKKIIIKPIEEQRKRTPSPELARFSPLVTRPPKPSRAAKAHAAAAVAADAMGATISQQLVSFPPSGGAVVGSSKRGRGRPSKGLAEKPEKFDKPEKLDKLEKAVKPKSVQVGLVTETVGCIVDEQGNKIWICPQCGRQDDGSPMIGCDKCDDWYHFTCVGIMVTPEEDTQWFCPRCRKKTKKDKK